MRQRNFWIGALVALLTFGTLTAFLGPRHHSWHRGWRHERCDGDRDVKGPRTPHENNPTDKTGE
ncbi:MAG TPA: hypothetical protein VF490_01190 [Chryseosolibacter sp.]